VISSPIIAFLQEMIRDILLNRLTTTIIESFPFEFGKCMINPLIVITMTLCQLAKGEGVHRLDVMAL